ncbi:MAG: sensor histidine kinase [Rhodocyclaceae bacterium]|nr:sensor histidine kinase [Rhodocyclaceae bacterium]
MNREPASTLEQPAGEIGGFLACVWLLVVLFLVWVPPARAAVLGPDAGLSRPASLIGEGAFYCGAPDERFEDVARPERADKFQPLRGVLAKGFVQETCWLRFTLQRTADAPREWWLEVGMPYLDDVTLFVGRPEMGFTAFTLGDRHPFSARPVPHRLFVFPLRLEDDRPVTAYLRIRTTSTMLVETVNVWQPTGLIAHAHREAAWYWGVFGLIALGALSNLVFWLWLREPIHRVYTVYLIALLFLNFVNSGFGAMWLFPDRPTMADRSIGFAVALSLLAGLWFFDRVFALRKNFPRLGRGIPWILALYALGALAALAGLWGRVAAPIQMVALLVTVGIGIAGPWLLWRGQRHLRLYVAAFGLQLAMVVAALTRNLGLWPFEISIDHFILGTSGLHVVLLNFALAERVRNIQRERQRLETEAARLDAELLALDQQREFMAMVAHEFRTPLAIVDTSAQLIASQLKEGKYDQAARCANIRDAVRRVTSLMDEYLSRERIEGATDGFNPAEVSLDALIGSVLAGFPEARVRVVRRQAPPSLHADFRLAQIALANLLSNALRYAPPDGEVRLEVEGAAEGGTRFVVADDGLGIPVEEQGRIFDKYFRGRGAQTQAGAGLGLYLVKRIAALHGGSVELESAPGKGTRFTLTLPGRSKRQIAPTPPPRSR